MGARWLIPAEGKPLPDVSVTVDHGIIRQIKANARHESDCDLGEVVLLPKLVNAHTHLEFSDLTSPIGAPGAPITDWIPLVISNRRSKNSAQTGEAVESGIIESIEAGTAAVGEIASCAWWKDFIHSVRDIHVRIFIERIGNQAQQVAKNLDEAKDWMNDLKQLMRDHFEQLSFGLSPHATYSVHPELFSSLIELAKANNLPVAMHLAESREELQWLKSGDGPFLDLIQKLGAMGSRPSGQRPLNYLESLAAVSKCLVVHGNYLDDEELEFVSRNRHRLSVVYCPRTHQFFEHEPYRLEKMLDRGINVAVGTDSRASNPDLNVWRELSTIRRVHTGIDPQLILKMGTVNGARALGVDSKLGSLSNGKHAEFLTLPVESQKVTNLFEFLLDSQDEPTPLNLQNITELGG